MSTLTVPSEHLAERLQDAEREVTFLDAAYTELRDGIRTWQEWNPELTCTDRQQAASEECAMALDEARAHLAALTEQATTGRNGAARNGELG